MPNKFHVFALSAVMAVPALTGCQRISQHSAAWPDQVLALLGKEKKPEPHVEDTAEVSKAAQLRLEKLLNHLPANQWVYLENAQQGTADLQNKSDQNVILSLRLNCKITSQRPSFSLSGADGKTLLNAYDDSAGAVQFLLDNKNFGNPFDLHHAKKLENFKLALMSAKNIKIFNASKLYAFQNNQAELLQKPVSCREP